MVNFQVCLPQLKQICKNIYAYHRKCEKRKNSHSTNTAFCSVCCQSAIHIFRQLKCYYMTIILWQLSLTYILQNGEIAKHWTMGPKCLDSNSGSLVPDTSQEANYLTFLCRGFSSKSVILNWGSFAPGDTRQCLETFLVFQSAGGCFWHPVGRSQGCC